MSTQLTLYGSSSDGHFYATTDGHFTVARDAASANVLDKTGDTMRIGLAHISPPLPGDRYRFYRMALYFDTSSVPDNATVVSAVLSLYLKGNLTIISGGIDLVLHKMKENDETYPHNPLVSGDFNRTLYVSGGASNLEVLGGASGYKSFTFNATGLAGWINDQGVSKFLVRSSHDVGYNLPQLYMLADFYAQEKGTSYRPRLVLSYALLPTVTTNAAGGLGATFATGNGTINSAQGESVTSYGVIWNDDGSDPVDFASADHYAAGSDLAAGNFSASITGLTASTSYYYRAYVQTVAGYGIGSAVQFTTTAGADVFTVQTDEPTNVAATTATANGTIIEDAGHSITQHGFVYKKGSDPGTPDDPTTAEAYTQKGAGGEGGYTSDLTGLDAGSIYYYRAYGITAEDGTEYGGVEVIRLGSITEVTFDAEVGSGSCGRSKSVARPPSGSTYACGDCADDPDADTAGTAGDEVQIYGATIYMNVSWDRGHCVRTYLYFDTSSIPDDVTIISVKLRLYVTNHSNQGWAKSGLTVKSGMATYPTESGGSPALQVSDYQLSLYTSDLGTLASGSIVVSAWNDITLTIATVNKTGLTKFLVTHIQECGGSGYDKWRRIKYYSANKTDYEPELVVEYVTLSTEVLPTANIADTWTATEEVMANIGDTWVALTDPKINIGDSWVDPQ